MAEPTIAMLQSTIKSSDLFHAVGIETVDPFPYVEHMGRKVAVTSQLEAPRFPAMGVEAIDYSDLGVSLGLVEGMSFIEANALYLAALLEDLGVDSVVVPLDFPLFAAQELKARGIDATTDAGLFNQRRRQKSVEQLEGTRRAVDAACAAMVVAGELIRELRPGLTSEEVRSAMRDVCHEREVDLPDFVIVGSGAAGAIGHEPGSGPITRGETVIVDICPRDRKSRQCADIARTYMAGGVEPSNEVATWANVVQDSLNLIREDCRAGVSGEALFLRSCEPFDAAGIPTVLTATSQPIQFGCSHVLGHGIGLDVHEDPILGVGAPHLLTNEVICVEPGVYRQGFGGVRFEDMWRVTDGGYELLSDLPYDL